MKLQTGSPAPKFTAQANDGTQWDLANVLSQNRWVLLVFYPGDDTAVCTKQLCDYRDNWARLNHYNVTIVGISTDNHGSHQSFSQKYQFPFLLLDDSNKSICRQFDMLSLIGMAQRGYVLISPQGQVAWIYREFLPVFRRTASEIEEVFKEHVPRK